MGEREICRGFRNNGTCRFGDKCKFEHSEGEPITDWDPKPAELCHTFREDGNCARGDTCRFKHGDDDPRFDAKGIRDVSDEVCRNFRRGKCVLGESCPRKHEAAAEQEGEGDKSGRARPRRGGKGRGKGQGRASGKGGRASGENKTGGGERRRNTNADADKPVEEQICQNYKAGKCRLENCPRIHEGSVEQLAVAKIDEICNNYKEGKCRFGDNCRRRHE